MWATVSVMLASACLACQSAPAGEQRTQSGSINFSTYARSALAAECLAAPDAKTYILGTVVRSVTSEWGRLGGTLGTEFHATVNFAFPRTAPTSSSSLSPRPRSLPGSVYFSRSGLQPRCPHGRRPQRALLTVRTATA